MYFYVVTPFLISLALSREIIFAPVAAIDRNYDPPQMPLNSLESDDHIALETDSMAGLISFAHLDHVPYFSSKADSEISRYDIAILGVPFNTGTSHRPGVRFWPHGIRDDSRRIRVVHSWNVYTERNSFDDWAKIVDCGDAPLTFNDNTLALKQLGKVHNIISERTANNVFISNVPRVLMLGGDQTITPAALRSTINHWGVTNVIHFDSHIDA